MITYKVNLVCVVEDDLKSSFPIATTPICRGECYSFTWIGPLYAWYVHFNAECKARSYHVLYLED